MILIGKEEGNYYDLDKAQVKLFPNFMSIPFDYTYLFNNRPILLAAPEKDLEKPSPRTRKIVSFIVWSALALRESCQIHSFEGYRWIGTR